MGRIYDHSVKLAEGQDVGYGLLERNGSFYVRFLDRHNMRVKRSLGLPTPGPKESKKDANAKRDAAHEKARAVIAQEFRQVLPQLRATWDEAIERLRVKVAEGGLRQTTLDQYLKDLRLIRSAYSATNGPADIDESMAETWLGEYTNGKDRRIRNKDKEARQHSAHNVKARLGSLSALWGKWFFDKLKIVQANPFAHLKPPKADKKEIQFVSDEQMGQFFGYLKDYYGDWSFPLLFFSVKAYTGSRLADLCGLKSAQLRGGSIIFPAGLTKGRTMRAVPLPENLYKSLQEYAGPTYLWENYPAQLKPILEGKGVPVHQLRTAFDPARLYQWVLNLFKSYREYIAADDKRKNWRPITSHQFRKRAFTLAWKAGVNPKEAAIAFGCNMDTLLKHYTHLDEQEVTDAVFAKLGANMLAGADGTQKGHNSDKTAPKEPTGKPPSE